ncbi:hypothetical protein Q5H93_23875 [Hymenobacter sp. ASUV-10]|uniref:Uncharacterized protein n=1 Tax=Hymenobacter aranciens TaxID=3063996 RepID=A0ABT9BMB8_9BACT|nr:hypothetical protein [Hymenobacter sp. ASUV-10]MDO7877796.1 hypothetical protein [Hymenobacter sp. ASUV-10]
MAHFSTFSRYLLALLLLLAAPLATLAQVQTPGVGIGTTAPDASAALDIVSSAKGALLPRLTASQRLGIASPATGLLVFQTDAPAGFYYNAGTPAAPDWQLLGAGDNLGNHLATQALNLQGNALTGTGTSISGLGVGVRADGGLNLGQRGPGHHLLLGYQAGRSLLPDSAAGEGLFNSFSGYQSGQATTTGSANVFGGYQSGYSNTSGTGNLFMGYQSGYANTTGEGNHFLGYHSGYSNTTGFANHFDGVRSGFANTTGFNNQYLGFNAGAQSVTGDHNLFVGYGSGLFNRAGSRLTALGANSGPSFLAGADSLTNATAVGADVSLTESNTVVLGNNASVGIGTSAPAEKLQVVGTVYSSAGGFRFPDNTVQTTAAVSAPANGFVQNQATPQASADFNVAGTGTVGGLLTAGSASVTGRVGIGTTTPTQALDVRGNLRLGDDGSGAGAGQAIEWVGPGVTSDPVGIYRLNPAADQSELRVVVGDVPDANDKFVVGRMGGTSTEGGIPTGSFTPTFSVSSTGQVQAPGLAGTGTRVVTADAAGTLATQALPVDTDAQQLSLSGSTLALTNGGSVTLPTASGDNLGNHTATQALDLGTNALVGNGGTTGLSVDAAGNAQLPAARAYTYAAAKAYTASYGPSDFQTAQVGVSVPTNKILNAPGGTFEQMYVDQAGTVRAALHLPQGAVVTSLLLYYNQSTANAASYITLELVANRMGSRGAVTKLATFTSAGAYTLQTPVTITPSAAVAIDNATFLYSLRATFGASSSTLSISGVTVNYTVTQAD